MQPTVKFDRQLVTVLVDEVVHVMLELTAPPAEPIQRPPVDVVVVLDRSGSMSGAPLAAVTAATAQLLRLAGPDDRLGVVAFDSEAMLVLGLDRHDPDLAGNRVRAIRSGGSTNLSGGWLKGLELLASSPRPEALRRIVVLTDGHANAGVTDRDRLVQLVKGGHQQGVTTTCIGFDDGHDEELLAALADGGMGNDYWCAGPDQAMAVFSTEFGGLANTVAQNVSVEIAPNEHVAAMSVLNEFPCIDLPGGVTQVALGDAFGGERRRVVAKFLLTPHTATGPVEIGRLTVRWAGVTGDVALHTTTIPVVVTFGGADDQAPPPDSEVVEEVVRLQVAQLRKDGRDAANQGDLGTARRLVQQSIDMLTGIGDPDGEVAALRTTAADLDEGNWSRKSAKREFSNMRTTSKGRRLHFEDDPTDDPGTEPGSGTV